MRWMIGSIVGLAVLMSTAGPGFALGMPLEQVEEHWTPVETEAVAITALRLEIVPARDPERDTIVWAVDETFALFNQSANAVDLSIGIPNAWSETDPGASADGEDFWAETYVNGEPVQTEVVSVVPNPAHPRVDYRVVRKFDMRLSPATSAYVRVLFALPARNAASGESYLTYPFQLRTLWGGAIDLGVIVVRWRDRVFSFRTNLVGYALYQDRAEWFLRDFNPSDELEIRFLPRVAVFQLVATEVGCPMPWEIVDRVSEGSPEPVRELLAGYGTAQLEICAELPAALRGSLAAARTAGLTELRLEQFTSSDSGISGPLFVRNPNYRPEDMTESESLYTRFLRQEVQIRNAE